MRIHRSALLLLLLACTPVFAQDADRKTGLTFSVGQGDSAIAVRRIVTPQWTLLGELSYEHGSISPTSVGGPNIDVTRWGIGAGVRRVFTSDQLHPFLQLAANINRATLPGCGHASYPGIAGSGGVEYFVARRVSIEGVAGLSYSRFSQRCSAPDVGTGTEVGYDSSTFSTFRSALSVTFYF